MILTVEELLTKGEFDEEDMESLKARLEGVEMAVRAYTNNRFQNQNVRFYAGSDGPYLNKTSPFIRPGDTVEIAQSMVNDGLYVVEEIEGGKIRLNKDLFTVPCNMVTKIEYPADVKSGVLNMMLWETENRKKVGIKSETLSRHSVTYYDQDSDNTVMGYPISIMGFLKPYRKARF